MGLGELLSIAAAATWALGVILYRRLGVTLSPLGLNLLKNALVAVLMLPTLLVVHGLAWPGLALSSWLIALLSGAIGIALADTLYFKALNELGAGRMGVIGNLFSPFVIVLSFVFLDERLAWLQVLGFVLVMAGVMIVERPERHAAGPKSGLGRGVLIGAAAVFCNAAAIVMVKPVLETEPFFWVAFIRLLGGLGALLGIYLHRPERIALPPWGRVPWRTLVLAAAVGQYLSMLLWLGGYKYTSASVASILNETASIFILLFAWLLLREPLGVRKLVGVLTTFFGVAVMLLV